jgi:indolepyruvate ferredoxin oxidoreductase beta subunit
MYSVILAGVGGQGVVLASRLIAQAAMNNGHAARTAETIGMAQRGGCVVSHVRVGEEIHSPLVPKGGADLILGFEPAEAVRALPYLKPDGVVITSTKAIRPVTASLTGSDYDGTEAIAYLKKAAPRLYTIDGDAIFREAGSSKVLNVALLGAAAALGLVGLTLEDHEKAIRERVAPRFVQMNLAALSAGARAVLN